MRIDTYRTGILILAASVFLGLGRTGRAQDKKMAVTFDDLPVTGIQYHRDGEIENVTRGLLNAITSRNIPAIGFVNERGVYRGNAPDPFRHGILSRWVKAGLHLGNHTYSHPDINTTEIGDYISDIVRGEKITRELLDTAGLRLQYFRHPMLHTGNTAAKKERLDLFLRERGYTVAPVTIDNSEWIYASAYSRAGDAETRQRVRDAYIAYMDTVVRYYEALSERLFGRLIPQVLLLHANALNGDAFGTLADNLRERGYSFITLGECLQDPAYATRDSYAGPRGLSWFFRWAPALGAENLPEENPEPGVHAFVQKLSGI